ncbi:MAG TPA: hypothetical protein VGM56_08020 [Byssovorax sp.]
MRRAALLVSSAALALVACAGPAAPAVDAPVAAPSAVVALVASSVAAAPRASATPSAAPSPSARAAAAPVVETDEPAPRDVHVDLAIASGARELRVAQRGALVSIRRGDERVTGADRAAFGLTRGSSGAPFVVELTSAKTLATTRVVVRLGEDDAIAARLATPPKVIREEARERHDCRAEDDGFGGVTVLCGVDAEVNAADLMAADEHAGVATASMGAPGALHPRTLVRFDFGRASEDGAAQADTKMLSYVASGRGVVLRAETSRAPGESTAALALLSESRRQPIARPTCAIGCRLNCCFDF